MTHRIRPSVCSASHHTHHRINKPMSNTKHYHDVICQREDKVGRIIGASFAESLMLS